MVTGGVQATFEVNKNSEPFSSHTQSFDSRDKNLYYEYPVEKSQGDTKKENTY